jgi:membrane protein
MRATASGDGIVTSREPAWQTIWVVGRDAYYRLDADDGFPLSGNIAFSIILSAFPFLLLLSTLAGFVGDADLALLAVDFLIEIVPRDLVEPLHPEIISLLTTRSQGLLTFSLAVTLWTASSGIKSVRTGLNRAYGQVEHRPYWLLGIQDVAFVIVGSIALLAFAGLLIIGPVVWSVLERWIPLAEQFRDAFHLFRLPAFVAIAAVIVMLTHLVLPAESPGLWHSLPGIVITVAIWTVGAWGYGIYVGNFANYASTYAGLAGVAIALMFLYITGAALLYGAEINQVLSLRRKARGIADKAGQP